MPGKVVVRLRTLSQARRELNQLVHQLDRQEITHVLITRNGYVVAALLKPWRNETGFEFRYRRGRPQPRDPRWSSSLSQIRAWFPGSIERVADDTVGVFYIKAPHHRGFSHRVAAIVPPERAWEEVLATRTAQVVRELLPPLA